MKKGRTNMTMNAMLLRVLSDRRGSMLIVGIPMGLFLTAVTWHLIGVCDAALLAEFLRFTADKSAFESAIWHARGMNVVAMLNVLMTGLSVVWASWVILQNSIGFAGSLCRPVGILPAYCNGHTETESIAIVKQMGAGRPAVVAWLANQGKAISDLQKVTSSVTPSIALNQTTEKGTGANAAWLEHAVSVSTALLPDDNIDAVTGKPIKGNYPRLGIASSLPSLPLESEPPVAYCSNIAALVPDVADALGTRLGAHWIFDVHTGTNYDWKANFILSANSMSCLGFAPTIEVAGIWYIGEYDKQMYHPYAFATWGLAFGKSDRPKGIDTGVQVAVKGAAAFDVSNSFFTGSQGEYYYDCGGKAWSKCQDSALMSPGWTARLRRIHQPPASTKGVFNALAIPASFIASLPANVQSVLSSPDALWNRAQHLIH